MEFPGLDLICWFVEYICSHVSKLSVLSGSFASCCMEIIIIIIIIILLPEQGVEET